MPTNEERRNVADSVRKIARSSCEVVDIYALCKALCLKSPIDRSWNVATIESVLHLADVIEPDARMRCVRCGYMIDDPTWNNCPHCGAKVVTY